MNELAASLEAALTHIDGVPVIEIRLLEDDAQGAVVLSSCTLDRQMLREVLGWGWPEIMDKKENE